MMRTLSGVGGRPCVRKTSSYGPCLSRRRRSGLRRAARPIQNPEPSSPNSCPQPPARRQRPRRSRAIAMEPVPAMTRIPGPPLNAAACASSTSEIAVIRSAQGRNRRRAAARLFGVQSPVEPRVSRRRVRNRRSRRKWGRTSGRCIQGTEGKRQRRRTRPAWSAKQACSQVRPRSMPRERLRLVIPNGTDALLLGGRRFRIAFGDAVGFFTAS